MPETNFVPQRQFVNAQGASFRPVSPAFPQPHNPQTFDMQGLYKFLSAGAKELNNRMFQKGQLNQLAGTYEKGKYGILGGAYDNGARYATATNDLAKAKVDTQQIINDGLASGESSQSILDKVQERTRSILEFADDIRNTHPQASNSIRQSVQGMQAQALQSYALGEQQVYYRNIAAGDYVNALNYVQDVIANVPRIQDPVTGRVSLDPQGFAQYTQRVHNLFLANAKRMGVQDPWGYADTVTANAWKNGLANVNFSDPNNIALVNSFPDVAQMLVKNRVISLQSSLALNTYASGLISKARNEYQASLQQMADNPNIPVNPQTQKAWQQYLNLWTVSGGDPRTRVRLQNKWRTKQNQGVVARSYLTSGAIIPDKDVSKVYNLLQIQHGQDAPIRALLMAPQNMKLASKGAQHIFDDALVNLPQNGSVVGWDTSQPQMQGKAPTAVAVLAGLYSNNMNNLLDPNIKAAIDSSTGNADLKEFFQFYGPAMTAEINAGTYDHNKWVIRRQEFTRQRNNINDLGEGAFTATKEDFYKFRWLGTNSTFGDLNENVAGAVADFFIDNKAQVNAIAYEKGFVYDKNNTQKYLSNNGLYHKTQNGYVVVGNGAIQQFSSTYQDQEVFLKTCQNLAKYRKDSQTGRTVNADNDTCAFEYDVQLDRMRILRQNGSDAVIPDEVDPSTFKRQYFRLLKQKEDKITNAPANKITVISVPQPERHDRPDDPKINRQLDTNPAKLKEGQQKFFDKPVTMQDVKQTAQDVADWIMQDPFQRGRNRLIQEYIDKDVTLPVPVGLRDTIGSAGISFKDKEDFRRWLKYERLQGTTLPNGTILAPVRDTQLRNAVETFINADPTNINTMFNNTVFYRYWGQYISTRMKVTYSNQGKTSMTPTQRMPNNQTAQNTQNTPNTMKTLQVIKAYDGRGGYNQYTITDTVTKGCFGANLGPKLARRIVQNEGFILDWRITNPKTSNKKVIGTGYDGGYDAFNGIWQGVDYNDPYDVSQRSNKTYNAYFANIPAKVKDWLDLDWYDVRDQAGFQSTALALADFNWHSGRNSKTYLKALKQVKDGNLDAALAIIKRSEAYRESQPSRKEQYLAGILGFDSFLKEREV